MFTGTNYKVNDKCVTKGALASVLISIFLSTLCLTVITASDSTLQLNNITLDDTRLVEILPSLLGAVVFFGSVYLINLIKSQFRKIINDLNLNKLTHHPTIHIDIIIHKIILIILITLNYVKLS